jgi:hypothetical protein
MKKWYKLDNSAIVYTSARGRDYTSLYRVSAILKHTVQPDILQEAVNAVSVRFPYYFVRLRKGMFWHYFEETDIAPKVKSDIVNQCKPIDLKEDNGLLMRVFYYNNRVSIEFFHVLTDGYGAMIFLKTLLADYFKRAGITEQSDGDDMFDISEPPQDEEYEDSYFKYGKSNFQMPTKQKKAFRFRGTSEISHTLNIITGIVDTSQVIAKAREYGVSVTEYLTAVLMQVYYERQKYEQHLVDKPIRLGVPINLRKIFPSNTMRNFIILSSPFIDPNLGDYTFEEILYDIKNYMKYWLNPKFLRAQMYMNIRTETNPFIRPIPLFLKSYIVKQFYKRIGARQNTAQISNVGIFKVPEYMEEHIERVEVMLGKPFYHSPNCSLITYKDKMSIIFCGCIKETNIEREFFRKLVKDGIHVKIESNKI